MRERRFPITILETRMMRSLLIILFRIVIIAGDITRYQIIFIIQIRIGISREHSIKIRLGWIMKVHIIQYRCSR